MLKTPLKRKFGCFVCKKYYNKKICTKKLGNTRIKCLTLAGHNLFNFCLAFSFNGRN